MRQEANMIYVNHIDNIKNIELCALYTWLLSIDDELFTKISDVSYARRDSAKVIKLLDTLRLVIRIDASASCRNAITHLRSMTTVDILAAAVSFGVTRTKTEKFIESLCVMTRTIYGSHTPFILIDDRSNAGLLYTPAIKSRLEKYAVYNIPDILELAQNDCLTTKDIIQWKTLKNMVDIPIEETLSEYSAAIDFLIRKLSLANKQESDNTQNFTRSSGIEFDTSLEIAPS